MYPSLVGEKLKGIAEYVDICSIFVVEDYMDVFYSGVGCEGKLVLLTVSNNDSPVGEKSCGLILTVLACPSRTLENEKRFT